MLFAIKIRLFALLTFIFILMTVLGTLTHELGHVFAAKLMGFDAEMNYEATSILSAKKITAAESFWITLAGPFETMLIGTIGFLFLLSTVRPSVKLSVKQWGLIFISLFWLRQSANLITWVTGFFINGYFGSRGDEIKLAAFLEVPAWCIIVPPAIIGFVILYTIIFRIIPKSDRFTFVVAGLFGGISGYWMWFGYLGKQLLP